MEIDEKQVSAVRKTIMVKTEGGMVKPRKAIVSVVNNESNKMISFKEYKEIYEAQEAELDRKIQEAVSNVKKDKNGNVLSATTTPDKFAFSVSNVKKDKNGNVLSATTTSSKNESELGEEAPLKHHSVEVSYHKKSDPHRRYSATFKTTHNGGKEETEKRAVNAFAAKGKVVYNMVHEELSKNESAFDWKSKKSEIDWKSNNKEDGKSKEGGTVYKAREGSRNAETGGAAAKKNVGRPEGEYGGYKIDKAARDSKEYKDALSAKVRVAKAEGFKIRDEFMKGMDAAIKKRQLEIAGIK